MIATGRRTPLNLPGASSLKSWHGWWSGYGFDPTLYARGTTPPAITWTGTVPSQCGYRVKCTLGGAQGTAKIQYSTDNGSNWSADILTSASPVTAGPLSLTTPTGTYNTDNDWRLVAGSWTGLSATAHQFLQSTAAKKPEPYVTAKGTPLRFDGADDIMICTSGLASSLLNGDDTPFTTMVVQQHVAFSASGDDCGFCISSSTTNALWDFFRHASTGKWASNKHGDAGSFVTVDSATTPDTSLHIHEIVHYGTTFDYWIDGTAILTGAAQDAPSGTFNALSLGATLFHGGENNWGNVDVYELLTWSGARSAAERAYNRQRLRNVYGI